MENNNVYKIVCKCVSSVLQCEVEEINEDSGLLVTFGWDSLAHVEIFCAIEEKFEFTFSDKMIGELVTVKDYVNYIKEKTNI